MRSPRAQSRVLLYLRLGPVNACLLGTQKLHASTKNETLSPFGPFAIAVRYGCVSQCIEEFELAALPVIILFCEALTSRRSWTRGALHYPIHPGLPLSSLLSPLPCSVCAVPLDSGEKEAGTWPSDFLRVRSPSELWSMVEFEDE